MKNKLTHNDKISENQKKRISDAKNDLQKLNEEIAPFIKVRKYKKYTTAGKWAESSSNFS